MKAGFTLLEALVALAIASVCLLALFGLQQQLVSGQRRYEAAIARAETRRNILALVRDLNPTVQPEGETALPDGERLSWASAPLTPFRRALTPGGTAAPSEVRLYAVRATLTGGDGVARDTVSVARVGWRPAAAQAGVQAGGRSPSPP